MKRSTLDTTQASKKGPLPFGAAEKMIGRENFEYGLTHGKGFHLGH